MNEARTSQGFDLPGFDRRGLVCGYELSGSKPVRLDYVAQSEEAPLWASSSTAWRRTSSWCTSACACCKGSQPAAGEGFVHTGLVLLGSELLSLALLRRTRVL